MDQVDHDGDVDASGLGFGFDAVDLMVVAIDQGYPATCVCGVAPFGFVEDRCDHRGGVVDHARGHPLRAGFRCRRWGLAGLAGQHVGGGAGYRGEVVDGADLGEAFAVALLALGQPALQLVGRSSGRFRGGWAQRVGSHHDALAIGGDDQQVALDTCLGFANSGVIERLDVDGGPGGQCLDLAFTQVLTGGALEAVRLPPPLTARGKTLGVLTLSRDETYDTSDVEHALDLARRAALALDNTNRYAFERDLAVTLQRNLLPRKLPTGPGFRASARYLPGARGTQVGGDWYD